MTIQQNNNDRFCLRAYGLPSLRILTKIILLGIKFLRIRLQILSESSYQCNSYKAIELGAMIQFFFLKILPQQKRYVARSKAQLGKILLVYFSCCDRTLSTRHFGRKRLIRLPHPSGHNLPLRESWIRTQGMNLEAPTEAEIPEQCC